jgi:hypothetical protein
VGHAHPEVVAAVHEQLELGSTFFANNERAILLAEEISRGDAVRGEDPVPAAPAPRLRSTRCASRGRSAAGTAS